MAWRNTDETQDADSDDGDFADGGGGGDILMTLHEHLRKK